MRDRLKFPTLPLLVLAALLLAALPGRAQFAASAPAAAASSAAPKGAPRGRAQVRAGDYIVAVVNDESVTANELTQQIAKTRDEAQQKGGPQPSDGELRKVALDALIEQRVLVTYARDNGVKVDDGEVDRAISNIAQANTLTLPGLRERLRQQGLDYTTFRSGLRDQILIERIREREVVSHIRVTDSEIADYIAKLRNGKGSGGPQVNIAQILITVPDGAAADVVAQRQARAEQALARVTNGEPFEQVAREMSEDANKARGGEMGARPMDRYPDLFANAVQNLNVGQATSQLVRSGAGFHVLKVLSRGEDNGLSITQTRVRHILLRPSAELSADAVERRMQEMRQQILDGAKRFEDLARQYSEDGSAADGGDLGWASPGQFVPEFEDAMNKLPTGGVSPPVRSRFGIHLIQVLDRRETTIEPKQLREQAVNALREQKFEPAYQEWVADLRAKAFIEYREPPL